MEVVVLPALGHEADVAVLDRADRVTLELSDEVGVSRIAGPERLPAERDLCVRAALALKSATGARHGAQIRLEKRFAVKI